MMFDLKRSAFVVAAVATMAGCDDSTAPMSTEPATVHGSVEETTLQAANASGSPQRAPGSAAQSVAVVRVEADGRLSELATAEVRVDGTFTVEGVPADETDLAVVAYTDGRISGRVLIHERTRGGVEIRAAPINYESTVEAEVYADLRAAGRTSGSVSSELSLFVHLDGSSAETVATSRTELMAVAEGYVNASATMTTVYSAAGMSLDARARSEVISTAAVDFAFRRSQGASLESAHRVFTDAAIDAFVGAGASLESTVYATAAAASTFDAELNGVSSVRGKVVAQAVQMNLRARARYAASITSSAEAALASGIAASLQNSRTSILSAGLDLRSVVEANLDALVGVASDASVDLLAAGASSQVRAEVRAAAEAALEEARLGLRLQSATSASASAEALVGYRAAVRSAVDAMIAASGSTTVDAEVVTSLFIAACAGAYIR